MKNHYGSHFVAHDQSVIAFLMLATGAEVVTSWIGAALSPCTAKSRLSAMVLRAEIVSAFEFIGCTPDTPQDEANRAYKRLALQYARPFVQNNAAMLTTLCAGITQTRILPRMPQQSFKRCALSCPRTTAEAEHIDSLAPPGTHVCAITNIHT